MSDVGVKVVLTSGRTLKQGKAMELGKLNQEYIDAVAICEMDKSTLAALGVEEGDPVRVKTDYGSVVVRSSLDRRAEPGIVFIPCGPYANAILDSDTLESGMPGFKTLDAKILPAKGESVLSTEELLKIMTEGS
ncbi:MAG: molybdopterin dinucleotide binding domain-containing protein [Candidatus Thorarchaeota archaeon]|jgi:formylmethanofuran dehydrogenase subunit D